VRDDHLHRLDREARQGDGYAARRRLIERLRRGRLDERRLGLAAYLGDSGAAVILGGAAPSPPDPLGDAAVFQHEAVEPARALAIALLNAGVAVPAPAVRPEELLVALARFDVEQRRGRSEMLGWVDAFRSGLGLPRASDLIRLGLWFRHLPRCDASAHARAGLAVLMRAWEAWRPDTLARFQPRLVAALAAVARWAADPSGGRATLARAVLAALPKPTELGSGAEALLALSSRLLPGTFDARRGPRPLELIAYRATDAICPEGRESPVSVGAETPLSHACWTQLLAGREERQIVQHAVRAILLPWAVGETDPLVDWLGGRPLPLAWAPPPPRALETSA
jgi:hypothetical protein